MNDYLILDLLFGVIVILFAAIGLWRGVVKEIAVTAALFAGAAIAASWADPWGADLARQTDLRDDVSKMLVNALALLGVTMILGYGSGSLIVHQEIGWGSRLAGGVLAAINGGLLLHYVLAGVERFFTGEPTREALDQSHVARLLLREYGWVLFGAAAVIALTMLIASLLERRSSSPEFEYSPTEHDGDHAVGTRGRPAKLPRGADDGKFEPFAAGFDPKTARYAADTPSVQQTIAMPPVDVDRVAAEGGRSSPTTRPAHPAATPNFASDEWIQRLPYAPIDPSIRGTAESDMRRTDETTESGEQSHTPGQNGHQSIHGSPPFSWIGYPPPSSSVEEGKRIAPKRHATPHCPNCFGTVGSDDDFCPQCGHRIV